LASKAMFADPIARTAAWALDASSTAPQYSS
jgi:hypothetical protein